MITRKWHTFRFFQTAECYDFVGELQLLEYRCLQDQEKQSYPYTMKNIIGVQQVKDRTNNVSKSVVGHRQEEKRTKIA